jgi:hypothetical protein
MGAATVRTDTATPIGVVDREQHGAVLGERAEDRQGPHRDGPLVRAAGIGLGAQEGDVDRAPLGRRDPPERVLVDRAQHVGQPREGQAGLGLRRAGVQDAHPPGGRPRDRLLPDRGLADPGVPLQAHRRHARRERVEELLERLQLGLATEDRRCAVHGRCRPRRETGAGSW